MKYSLLREGISPSSDRVTVVKVLKMRLLPLGSGRNKTSVHVHLP